MTPVLPVCMTNMRPVLTTLALARRVERAEIDFCAVLARVGESGGAGALEVGGGCAVCGDPGLPMNKVLGLGLGADVTDEDLDALEAFYDERGSPIQIELCPLAPRGLTSRLSKRGYELLGFESQMGRAAPFHPIDMHDADARARARIRIERTSDPGDEDLWNRVVSEGFIAAEGLPTVPPPADVFAATSAIMRGFVHPGITRYLAFVDDHAAGGCASFEDRGVLGIFGTATLPRFRRRGIQTALVSCVLKNARRDTDLAIATTEAGSTSQRTFERLGFRLLYTRAILVRK
jgi:GNAT superfamily N-acetyltransferase